MKNLLIKYAFNLLKLTKTNKIMYIIKKNTVEVILLCTLYFGISVFLPKNIWMTFLSSCCTFVMLSTILLEDATDNNFKWIFIYIIVFFMSVFVINIFIYIYILLFIFS